MSSMRLLTTTEEEAASAALFRFRVGTFGHPRGRPEPRGQCPLNRPFGGAGCAGEGWCEGYSSPWLEPQMDTSMPKSRNIAAFTTSA